MRSTVFSTLVAVISFGLLGRCSVIQVSNCKTVPSSPLWPQACEWSKFNETLGGKLLAPLPPAIVCDPSHGKYNKAACKAVGEQWFFASFYDADPVSLQGPNWQNDGCLPAAVYNVSTKCNLRPYPKYTVNVSSADDIIKGVKFAAEHNIRVSVKNTGHDYLGRSTSPELSLWTHNLKGIQVHSSFRPKGSKGAAVPAMTIKAGNQMGEIYQVTGAHGLVIAGGADPSVGLGGYLTSGGHSPLGALHGLAVDNVLELEMVTPSGQLITANDNQHSDLFWAMRGGGGSTFGVLVSVTVKTYQDLPVSNFTLQWIGTEEDASKNNSLGFYSILAEMYTYLPEWSDNDMNGYFTFAPASLLGYPAAGNPPAIGFGGYLHNKTLDELHKLMDPFVAKLNATKGVMAQFSASHVSRAADILVTSDTDEVSGAGYNAALGSRLWPKEALMDKEALIKIFQINSEVISQGLLVSGPAVRNFAQPQSVSVTPAWRRSYLHTLISTGWGYRNATAAKETHNAITNVYTKALRDHAPNMGAYLNEADKHEPDWQQTFWGADNYKRLLSIKRKYDPNGMFWCEPCVGHEDWHYNDATGQLCKVDLEL